MINIKFSKWEIRTLLLALFLAGEWENSMIDSYNYTSSNPEVKKSKRRIQKFQDLKKKIKGGKS